MIRVIGKHGCSRCEITKQILDNKGIDYSYEYLSDLSTEEQEKITNMAIESAKISMPMILKDNKLVDVKEI
jgi:glutaredoxin